jgi:hypothetical protein
MGRSQAKAEKHMTETIMSEYIEGFNAGYAYVLEQIERHPHLTMAEILTMLKGQQEKQDA